MHDKQGGTATSLIAHDDLKRALTRIMVVIAQGISPSPTQETIQALGPMMPHLAEVAEQYTACLADEELPWPFVGLGRFYDGQGMYTLAEPWYALCLTKIQERFGGEHPTVALSLNNLALLYANQEQFERAVPLLEQAVRMLRQLLGEEHPSTQRFHQNLEGVKAAMR